MQKTRKHPGRSILIMTLVIIAVVLLTVPLLKFCFKVMSTANTLNNISSKISDLEYKAKNYYSGYDFNADIQDLYKERNAYANSDDSIISFLATSTGKDDSPQTQQNRSNRMLLIICCITLFSLLCLIDAALIIFDGILITHYLRYLVIRRRRNRLRRSQ